MRQEGDAKCLGSAWKLSRTNRILVGFLYPTLMENSNLGHSYHFMDCNIKNICQSQPCQIVWAYFFSHDLILDLIIIIDPNLVSSLVIQSQKLRSVSQTAS